MKNYFVLLLALLIFSCQFQSVSRDTDYKLNGNTISNNITNSMGKNEDNETILSTTNLECGNKDFKFDVVYKNEHKSIQILEGNTTKKLIKLPNQNEVNGFSLIGIKKTNKGFEMSIEYGSRYYYKKKFSFICEQNNFYFVEIKVESFDKQNPEKLITKNIKINPKVPVESFQINDFIGND